jgi:hypothetical protein
MIDISFINELQDELERSAVDLTAEVQSTIWTGLKTVRIGAEIAGEQLVSVIESERQYRHQVYYTELDGSAGGKVIDTTSDRYYGRIVEIGYPPGDKKRLHVHRIVTMPEIDPAWSGVGVPPHAGQHELIGLGIGETWSGKVGHDPVRIEARQLWNASVQPWDGMVAYLAPGWYWLGQRRLYYPGAELADLTAQQPSGVGYAKFCLIELDENLTVYYSYGPEFLEDAPPMSLSALVPEGTDQRFQVGAILLTEGMTQITFAYIWAGLAQWGQAAANALMAAVCNNNEVVCFNDEVVWL